MTSGDIETSSASSPVKRPATWIAAVAIVVLVGVWWLLRPGALEPVANGVGFEVSDAQPRLTSYVVVNRRPIEVVSVSPAHQPPEGARVSFVACRWRDPLQAFATDSGPVTDHCAETRNVEGLVLEHESAGPSAMAP